IPAAARRIFRAAAAALGIRARTAPPGTNPASAGATLRANLNARERNEPKPGSPRLSSSVNVPGHLLKGRHYLRTHFPLRARHSSRLPASEPGLIVNEPY